jgi:uncharacterized Tic20 family protein
VTTTPPDPDDPYGQAPPPPPGPPTGGYGQPGAPYQQAGPPLPGEYATGPLMSDPDQRLWATLAHLSGLVLSIVGPLVIYLLMKDRGRFVRSQALEALNFQITVLIAVVVSAALIFVLIGLFLLPIIGVAAFVLMILAAIAANRGEEYRYPLTLRLVS